MRTRLAYLLLAACGTDVAPDDDVPPPPPELTTWYRDVGPIVAEKCMGCHQDGGLAPFSLTTYEAASTFGMQMLSAIEDGVMPPWSATTASDCAPTRPWMHDPRLTAGELDTVRAWIEDGRPAGEAVELVPGTPEQLTGVTHALVPSQPFVTSGETDQFKCFVLDPALASDMYLTGWDVAPGNRAVVHHVVIMSLASELLQAARNANVVGVPLDCVAIPMETAIGAWAPGQGPTETPEGVGAKLSANTGVLMQIHYHPGGNENAPDATAVNLRLTTTPPAKLYEFGGWGNAGAAPALQPGPNDPADPTFVIPPNVADHTETMRFTIAEDAPRRPMFIMQPHQHYVGTRVELRIHRATPPTGEPADECLINNDWNFDWQRTYRYDVPVAELPTVGGGDEIEIRCTYDNTLANPFVQRALAEQGLGGPIEVELGEQTLDEMCLGLVGLIGDDVAPAKPAPPLEFSSTAITLLR